MRINLKEKENNMHYIGVPILNDERQYIMNYSYRYRTIMDHLSKSSSAPLTENLDIMYLIKDSSDVYYVILKTFWLRIIQRKWKKKMEERKEKQRYRCHILVQFAYRISHNPALVLNNMKKKATLSVIVQ